MSLSSRYAGKRRHVDGVYAVGHRKLTQHGIWLAAVKACGPDAALSHQSVAQLLKLLPLPDSSAPVHVTVPSTSGRRSRRGIHLHRSKTLSRAEIAIRDGIPVTKPRRTLIDLRRVLPRERWEDALDRARVLSLAMRPAAWVAGVLQRLLRDVRALGE